MIPDGNPNLPIPTNITDDTKPHQPYIIGTPRGSGGSARTMEVTHIEYYDEKGNLLFEEPMIFSCLWALRDTLVENYVHYQVMGRFVIDEIQVVELRKI